MKRIIYVLILLMTVSCSGDMFEKDFLAENTGIIGTWVQKGTTGDISILEREDNLDPASYGFVLRDDGKFIERKNAGFCGTPPITYDNFDGEWIALSDSLLDITVGFWGGTINYQMRIVTLGDDILKVRYLYGEDRANSK
jgi:hypothetical protein